MKKNYGIPYQGSKAKIVNKLIEFIPPAENFYDLFGVELKATWSEK